MKKFLSSVGIIVCAMLPLLCMTGCAPRSSYTYADESSYLVGSATIETASISKLDVDWVVGAVEIIVDNSCAKIEVLESSEKTLNSEEMLRYKLDQDGVLTIKYRKSSKSKIAFKKNKKLTIKLPSSISIANQVSVNVVSANVKVENLNVSKLNIQSVSGEVVVGGGRITDVELSSASGNIKAIGEAIYSNIKINNVSGEVSLSQITCGKLNVKTVSGASLINLKSIENATLTSTSGSIELQLPQDILGFAVKFLSMSGKASSTFNTTVDNSTYTYRNGSAKINVETVSGNLTIKEI